MTKFIGKGVNGSLCKVHIVDENNQIIKILTSWKEIEEAIISHNRTYLKQAYQTKIYQDRIYKNIKKDIIRNKILSGNLSYKDCDNENVYQFLKLL